LQPRAPDAFDTEPETDAEFATWIGKVLAGKYEIDGLLGKGGMGIVASGRQLQLDRPVAIKLLRRSLSADPRLMQRFEREARAIARMRSDHVVRVIDVGVVDGLPFIVMERLVGNDLATELAAGPFAIPLAIEYVLQACVAIGEAHAGGIVHRDIKPSNLFLASGIGSRRQLKVLDFGVSKWLCSSADSEFVTGERSLIGTPAYAAPEQLTRPESVDERADIWSLGLVLYHALSGAVPFKSDSVPRLCAQILTSEPRPLANVPRQLSRVVLRCLRKDPDQRFRNVAELAQALAPFAPTNALYLVEAVTTFAKATSPGLGEPRNETSVQEAGSALHTASEFTQDTEAREVTVSRRSSRAAAAAALGLALASAASIFLLRAPAPENRKPAKPDTGTQSGARSALASAPERVQVPAPVASPLLEPPVSPPPSASAAGRRSRASRISLRVANGPAPVASPSTPMASSTPKAGDAQSVAPARDFDSSLYRR